MSKLIVKCMCGAQLTTSTDAAGQVMACPICKQHFRVPGSQSSTAPAAQDLSRLNLPAAPHVPRQSPATSNRARSNSAPSYSAPTRPVNPHVGGYSPYGQRAGSGISDATIRLAIIGTLGLAAFLVIAAIGWSLIDKFGDQLVASTSSSMSNGDAPSSSGSDAVLNDGTQLDDVASSMPSANTPPDSGFNPSTGTDSISNDMFSPVAMEVSGMSSDPGVATTSMPTETPSMSSSTDISDLIARIEPSVVRIDNESTDGNSVGSGFVVDSSGLIVTNYHVVEGANRIKVTSNDGRVIESSGFLIAVPSKDICVIQVDPNQFPCRPIAPATAPPRKGEPVAAFGSPLGFSFSATNGIVSAFRTGDEVRKSLDDLGGDGTYARSGYAIDMDWVQTSAAISGGNSGGPLVNMRGEYVGVNTMKLNDAQNLNFAVAFSTVLNVLETRQPSPQSFASLPRPTASDTMSGVLAAIFGSESIVPSDGTMFQKSSERNEIRNYSGHTNAIIDVAISPDGRYLATAGLDNKMTMFDMSSGATLYTIATTTLPIRGVDFAANSKYLVTFRSAGTLPSVAFRDPATGKTTEHGVRAIVPKEAGALAVSDDGRSVFASWIDGTVRIRRYSPLLDTFSDFRIYDRLPITSAAFSPDGSQLLVAGDDGALVMAEMNGAIFRKASFEQQAHKGRVNSVAFASHGKAIATGGDDGNVFIWRNWSKANQWRSAKLLGDNSQVLSVAFSPDASQLAVGRASGRLEIWGATGNKLITEFPSHDAGVSSVEFLASGKHIVSGSANGKLRIFALP